MNNTTIERDLHHLLPTHAGILPPELLSLASSLLAQSRTRISNLKANEEIARSYVCAHIACERLKNTLDLPPLDPNPPLPKRPYNTLLSQFRKALPETTTKKSRRNLSPSPTPAGGKRTIKKPTDGANLPDGVMQAIKRVCGTLVIPNAEPYIITAVTIALPTTPTASKSPSKKKKDKAGEKEKDKESSREEEELNAIVAAATLLVIERLIPPNSSAKIGTLQWKREEAYAAKVKEIFTALGVKKLVAATTKHVEKLSDSARTWIAGVPDGGGVRGVAGAGIGGGLDSTGKAKKRKREAGGSSGIGSMLQERVDYLSERKRRAYKEWEKIILKRVEEIERMEGA